MNSAATKPVLLKTLRGLTALIGLLWILFVTSISLGPMMDGAPAADVWSLLGRLVVNGLPLFIGGLFLSPPRKWPYILSLLGFAEHLFVYGKLSRGGMTTFGFGVLGALALIEFIIAVCLLRKSIRKLFLPI